MDNIITLGQEQTKTNQTCTVKLANAIADTPVVPFFLKNYAELIEAGQAPNVMNGSNQSKAIYVEIADKVVAHIVFDVLKDSFNTVYIVLSCVDKNYRKQGIYNIMHKHFEAQAKKLGSTKIMSFVHVNNKARLISCESIGMKSEFHRMEKRI